MWLATKGHGTNLLTHNRPTHSNRLLHQRVQVTDLAALVGESYERAYTDMVRVQQLTELEEVIAYKGAVERRTGGRRTGRAGQRGARFPAVGPL
jgi:hypothetical protein